MIRKAGEKILRKIMYRVSVLFTVICVFLTAGQFPEVFSEQIFPSLEPDEFVLFEDDFEDSLSNWSPLGGQATLEQDTRYSKKGNYSLVVKDRVHTWSGPYLKVSDFLLPGETYNFHAYVNHNLHDTKQQINLILQYETSEKKTEYAQIATVNARCGWNLIDQKFTMPADMVSAGIYFELLDVNVEFYVDNFVISGSKETPPVSENENGRLEYTFSFEEGYETWKSRGDAVIETSSNFSYTGRYSLYVSERTSVWNGAQTDISSMIEEGVPYRYSAYVMYNGKSYGPEHGFHISVEYSLDGKTYYPVIAEKTVQKGNWSKISGDFTLPEGAINVFMFISTEFCEDADAGPDDRMPFYIDNVQIEDGEIIKNAEKALLRIRIAFIAAGLVVAATAIYFIMRSVNASNFAMANASLDTMTNTLNRNSYEIEIMHLTNCPADCKKLWVTICDLNYLKHINDNYGHQKGDSAIVRCASVLTETVGKKGMVYRTGGDEFVCITRKDVTEKLRQAFSIEAQQYKGYPFSAAVGSASYSPDEDGPVPDIKLILARGDKDMYKNKEEVKKNMPV